MTLPIDEQGILEDLRRLLSLTNINKLKPILPTARITVNKAGAFLSFKGTNFYAIGKFQKQNRLVPSENLVNYPSIYDLVARAIINMPYSAQGTASNLYQIVESLETNLGSVFKSLAGTL